jgi:isopentenyl phosphate kinase
MLRKVVLKIGGSVITDKDTKGFPTDVAGIRKEAPKFVRMDVIERIAKEIKAALEESRGDLQIVLINGVGPFGHHLVAEKAAGDVVRKSTSILNEIVIEEMRKAGIDVVPIQPGESVESDGKGGFDISYLWEMSELLIEEGKVPSVWGDMLKDGKVISGDDLVVLIARKWGADLIVMATDTDGVYDKNPSQDKGARLVRKIDSKTSANAAASFTLSRTDVTGGMEGKVRKLLIAANEGIRSQVVNGLKEGIVKKALIGDEGLGTIIG